MPTIPQHYRRTDRQTTYYSNTALALRASRDKNVLDVLNDEFLAGLWLSVVATTNQFVACSRFGAGFKLAGSSTTVHRPTTSSHIHVIRSMIPVK